MLIKLTLGWTISLKRLFLDEEEVNFNVSFKPMNELLIFQFYPKKLYSKMKEKLSLLIAGLKMWLNQSSQSLLLQKWDPIQNLCLKYFHEKNWIIKIGQMQI